jgi:hypothetical protein
MLAFTPTGLLSSGSSSSRVQHETASTTAQTLTFESNGLLNAKPAETVEKYADSEVPMFVSNGLLGLGGGGAGALSSSQGERRSGTLLEMDCQEPCTCIYLYGVAV